MTQSRETPLYGNCIITAPDGQPLCRTNETRIQWYVERNLGEIVSENPTTLRLRFEPKGRNAADHPYTTAEKRNICVVCGTNKRITRHHVVPIFFRKHFPLEKKDRSSHDVLILCVDCHNKYEEHALDLRKMISEELGIPPFQVNNVNLNVLRARKAARALLEYRDKMPEDRKDLLLDRLRTFLGKEDVSREDMEFLSDANIVVLESGKSFGQVVVEQVDIDAFIRRWRGHFVSTMSPKFLPAYWGVDNKL